MLPARSAAPPNPKINHSRRSHDHDTPSLAPNFRRSPVQQSPVYDACPGGCPPPGRRACRRHHLRVCPDLIRRRPQGPSDQWQENFDEQMARQLKQEPSLRGSLIKVVIDQAAKKEDLRLSETADALLDVIEEDPGEQRRVLAIQALSVIGTEHLGEEQYGQVMNRLYALSKEDPSAEVRAAAGDLITRYQAG